MTRGSIALLGLVACSPGTTIVGRPSAAGVNAWVFARSRADGAPTALYAFDARVDPIALPEVAGETYRAVGFAEPLERLLSAPGPGGAVPLPGADATLDEVWPLPASVASFELGDEGFEATAPSSTAIRVPRPPCPPLPAIRPITGLGERVDPTGVARWGDELLIGSKPEPGFSPGGVYRVRVGETSATPLAAFAGAMSAPKLLVDRDLAEVYWVSPSSQRYELARIDARGEIVSSYEPIFEGVGASIFVEELAGARFGDARTIVARIDDYASPTAKPTSKLMWLDEVARMWRPFDAGRDGSALACPDIGSKLHLEVDGLGRGLAGVKRGPLARFDLSQASAPLSASYVPADRLCRAARAFTRSGLELVVYSLAEDVPAHERNAIVWRRPGGEWADLPTRIVLSGQALAAIGDLIFVGVEGDLIGMFEDVPSRPELPPRLCGELPIAMYPHFVLPLDDRRAVVSGFRATGVAYLELDP